MTYHKCFCCRRVATESVVTTTLRKPDGKLWAMYACSLHRDDMYQKSDELLGVNNGVLRIYSSTTGGFDKSESEDKRVQDFHAQVAFVDSIKQKQETSSPA
jgi:hypothetical protein